MAPAPKRTGRRRPPDPEAAALARELVEERGSATILAAVLGVTTRSVERAKAGVAGPRVLSRLRLAGEGEVFDQAREERLRLYEQRFARGEGIFDGRPARDGVTPAQLADEAEEEELARTLGVRQVRKPSWAV